MIKRIRTGQSSPVVLTMVPGGLATSPTMPDLTKKGSPYAIKALGWLARFMTGDTFKEIAEADGVHPKTVMRNVRKVTDGMVETVQQDLIRDVIPLATQVLKAALKQQLALADAGTLVDTSLVERILKGMYVLESPALRDGPLERAPKGQAQLGEGEGEEESLSLLLQRRTIKQQSPEPPLLPDLPIVAEVKVLDADVQSEESSAGEEDGGGRALPDGHAGERQG